MGRRLLLLACALTPPYVGSFGLLPSSLLPCRRGAFHPSPASTSPPPLMGSQMDAHERRRHRAPLASSQSNSHNRHRLSSIPAAASPGPGRYRSSHHHSLAMGLDEGQGDRGEEYPPPVLLAMSSTSSFSSPSDGVQQEPEGAETAPSPQKTSLPPAYRDNGDAEAQAEAALRKLSPSELAGMKSRLGLDDSLEGEEQILASAVPILADKIRARAAAQEVTQKPTRVWLVTAGLAARRTCCTATSVVVVVALVVFVHEIDLTRVAPAFVGLGFLCLPMLFHVCFTP